MKQAKITCTLGTTTDDKSVLEKMVEFGMTDVRINTAYATIEDYSKRINLVREVSKKTNYNLDIMLDIKGPQIRLGDFNFFNIHEGMQFYVGFPEDSMHECESKKVIFNKDFCSDLNVGDSILIENGSIATKIETRYNSGLLLKVINPGEGIIHKYMGVNVPGVYLNVDKLSDKDKEVIKFGLDNDVEKIALSFVRDSSDVKNCYDFMRNYSLEKSKKTELCLKIEDKFGVKNLNKILDYTKSENIKTSVMIARGDLFVELEYGDFPLAQESIISTCKKYDVPVIIGTGVLSSMQHGIIPSRAEVCDIYYALKSGVDNFMLSGETSFGKDPALVVKTLSDISRKFYEQQFFENEFK
ncbi:MAG: pyruvate kinase [Candidatus Woesearchaeota archaeon]